LSALKFSLPAIRKITEDPGFAGPMQREHAMEATSYGIWRAVFEAEQRMLNCRCPFVHHSLQAAAWEDGWKQDLLKREDLAYRDRPLSRDSRVRDQAVTKLRQWRLWSLK
jgi:hypothetical protein